MLQLTTRSKPYLFCPFSRSLRISSARIANLPRTAYSTFLMRGLIVLMFKTLSLAVTVILVFLRGKTKKKGIKKKKKIFCQERDFIGKFFILVRLIVPSRVSTFCHKFNERNVWGKTYQIKNYYGMIFFFFIYIENTYYCGSTGTPRQTGHELCDSHNHLSTQSR